MCAGNIPILPGARSKSCDDNFRGLSVARVWQVRREGSIRIRRPVLKSSHDLILFVGPAIAVAVTASSMRHNSR